MTSSIEFKSVNLKLTWTAWNATAEMKPAVGGFQSLGQTVSGGRNTVSKVR